MLNLQIFVALHILFYILNELGIIKQLEIEKYVHVKFESDFWSDLVLLTGMEFFSDQGLSTLQQSRNYLRNVFHR